ncbi:F0F1 ATP synthase subunit B [Aerococcaceae bacterium DSM 111020]|nr:F0F1 ATP synthase subunit B [Aerococcaceae bacterium DSM 111020]
MLFSPTSLGNALMTLIAFLILFYVIYRFAYQPVMNILNERRALIDQEIEKGSKAQADGEATVIEANELMQQARTESVQIVQDARKQAKEEQQQTLRETEQSIVQMKDDAQMQLDHERAQMRQEMEQDTITLAVELTKKLVQKEVTAQDHQDIIQQFIERLEANAS